MAVIVGTCDIERAYGVKVSGEYAYVQIILKG